MSSALELLKHLGRSSSVGFPNMRHPGRLLHTSHYRPCGAGEPAGEARTELAQCRALRQLPKFTTTTLKSVRM